MLVMAYLAADVYYGREIDVWYRGKKGFFW
jgi:hypothetical protein